MSQEATVDKDNKDLRLFCKKNKQKNPNRTGKASSMPQHLERACKYFYRLMQIAEALFEEDLSVLLLIPAWKMLMCHTQKDTLQVR